MRPQPRIAALIVLLAGPATAPGARAQFSGEVASAKGEDEGRQLGRQQGQVEGRAEALYEEFRSGFRQGLDEARESGGRGELARKAEEEGELDGHEAGRAAGAEAGAEAARKAWIESPQRPRRPEPPGPPPVPSSIEPPGCPPTRRVRLGLARGIKVDLELEGLESRESPIEIENFDLAFPPDSELRQRARNAGAVSYGVDDWVRDYKFAFQSAWSEAYNRQRSATPPSDLAELRGLGLEEGRREGERRLACDALPPRFRAGFQRGWSLGWRSGFLEGWDETDARHASHAVVVVQDARLIDASGDGLLEPGEGLRLEATLVNAGSEEALRSAGSWSALRGLEAEGYLEGGLGPGEDRLLRLELGEVDADAPPGTSVVVQVRGLGSEPETLSERLGRPARIEEVSARLEADGGRLRAEVEASVRSASPASARTTLRLEGEGVATEVGRLAAAEARTATLTISVPVPEELGGALTGVLVLRAADGTPWNASRWSARFDLREAVRLAAAPGAPEGLAALLLKQLSASWTGAASEELPATFEDFAGARAALPADRRERLDRIVTDPLLAGIEGSDAPKRLRRLARERLEG